MYFFNYIFLLHSKKALVSEKQFAEGALVLRTIVFGIDFVK